ncbi:uncharacterized protein Tco025E_08063 [Trypanosoma conorhini]|uniref:Uncharacterized protein n=1 Tax=Trypanosoma conorhini TaxID=83891 RepID=A0A422NEM1_9TRYP|nr:uncharacterized protein Tco025E_08063 [Trypanosoma conorhini]RNF03908.1 hypothetical protein Tco025E_08063 [Trypanosoma conorhini]
MHDIKKRIVGTPRLASARVRRHTVVVRCCFRLAQASRWAVFFLLLLAFAEGLLQRIGACTDTASLRGDAFEEESSAPWRGNWKYYFVSSFWRPRHGCVLSTRAVTGHLRADGGVARSLL